MRALRFVKASEDGTHVVVETTDGGEQFSLPLDTALRDAARADLPRSTPLTAEPEPTIRPREIQTRVRAGESPQALAEEHGMTLERILRFAGPVLEERERVTGEARRARARRSTTEGQTVVFGEAVDARFGAYGIDPAAVRWDACRREDGQWTISAHWVGGEADRVAEWTFHLGSRTVTPLDDTAADLLSDRPIEPISVAAPTGPVPPLLAPGVVAFPAMPDAHTGPLPTIEQFFDQEAADADASRARHRTPVAEPPAQPVALADTDSPATLPLALPEPEQVTAPVNGFGGPQRSEPTEEERAARTRIPTWDDILLGVRRKRD
jgi:hypothetical protein